MHKFRYAELDWLRVILIFAVFLHHVFMPFNGDGWHVMNNESSKLLDDIMVYFEQLRLQSLFFIAGAGSFLLLQKCGSRDFLISKFNRLFIPLLIGMIFIVPPQIFYENIHDYKNIVQAYKELALSFHANHLWFIEFLIVFMILAIPLNKGLQTNAGDVFINGINKVAKSKYGLFSLVAMLIAIRLTLQYFMQSADHNIQNLSVSVFFLWFFIAGMCFIKSPDIWQSVTNNRSTNLKILIFSSVLFYGYYFSPDLSEYASQEVRWQLWWIACTLVSWSGLLALLGYASAICTSTPKWLQSTNELIYPFYILHQTIIVIIAFYIIQWDAGIAVKSIFLLLSSLLASASICYLLIRPFKVMRYIFGLNVRSIDHKPERVNG